MAWGRRRSHRSPSRSWTISTRSPVQIRYFTQSVYTCCIFLRFRRIRPHREERNIPQSTAGKLARALASSLILNATFSFDALPQAPAAPVAQSATPSQTFNAEQLDALFASIALYPDDLLTQVLMASTFPFEVVSAARWLDPSSVFGFT
jgi:hypothetical protein